VNRVMLSDTMMNYVDISKFIPETLEKNA